MSGLSTAGLECLAEVAASHVTPNLVPGLVVLVASGDDVHVEALGVLSIGGAPMRRDSLFRIASTTKPITGAVTMALVGEGLLLLDESVEQQLLPELAAPLVLRRMDGPLNDTVAVQREERPAHTSSAPCAPPACRPHSTSPRTSPSTSTTTPWKTSAESIWCSTSSAATSRSGPRVWFELEERR
jgi:hypothetical protein